MKLQTSLFGALDVDHVEGAYVARAPDRPSLYVSSGLSQAQLDHAATMIEDVAALDASARARLAHGDLLIEAYLAFHREELGMDATIALLQLVGLGVRPETFVLDYSLGTDELLVVSFDADRNLVSVAHES